MTNQSQGNEKCSRKDCNDEIYDLMPSNAVKRLCFMHYWGYWD